MNLSKYNTLFGLIGLKLDYSFSKKYFNKKFSENTIEDHFYELFPIKDISLFVDLFNKYPNLVGLNVTIPYKESILPYLDDINVDAKSIGAVNTVVRSKGKLVGYNTDIVGAERTILDLIDGHDIDLCYILGTGGASLAIQYVLKKLDLDFIVCSRRPESGQVDNNCIKYIFNPYEKHLFINTTPVGTAGNVAQVFEYLPFDQFSGNTFIFDLVYNPPITPLMRKAKQKGAHIANGYSMLVAQAEASYDIWTKVGK